MYRKLEELEESCWGKFFRFEKSHAFIQFEKRYSIPGVLRFRIDDGIYFLVLAVIIVVFCVLPSQSDHELTSAFRQFLIFYGVASVVWLLTPHWYKHLVYFFFCVVFPLLVLLIYYNVMYRLFRSSPSTPSTQRPRSSRTWACSACGEFTDSSILFTP